MGMASQVMIDQAATCEALLPGALRTKANGTSWCAMLDWTDFEAIGDMIRSEPSRKISAPSALAMGGWRTPCH
jgi:hypothetical protein